MAKSSALNLNLPPLDDLFSTQESRDEAKLTKIHDIPLSEIDDFPETRKTANRNAPCG